MPPEIDRNHPLWPWKRDGDLSSLVQQYKQSLAIAQRQYESASQFEAAKNAVQMRMYVGYTEAAYALVAYVDACQAEEQSRSPRGKLQKAVLGWMGRQAQDDYHNTPEYQQGYDGAIDRKIDSYRSSIYASGNSDAIQALERTYRDPSITCVPSRLAQALESIYVNWCM